MPNRPNIEELRDMVCCLKNGAESLYRYGDVGYSKTLFDSLTDNDQKILLYLAFNEDDKDIINVAKHLMQQLNPELKDVDDLLTQIDPDDKVEIEKIESYKKQEMPELSDIERQIILEILTEACDKMGLLGYEKAFWVLVPPDSSKSIIWIQACGKGENDITHIKLPNQVLYDPDKNELYKLLNTMRASSWVLHIHNHPQLPDTSPCYGASSGDIDYARYWKHLRPELTAKMKFFIILQNTAIEYLVDKDAEDILWLGKKVESKPLSDKEYYNKQFPIDVARQMQREKIRRLAEDLFKE